MGCRRFVFERSLLQPGDTVVESNDGSILLPAGNVALTDILDFSPNFPLNPRGASASSAAGFYGASLGPVPFAIGEAPKEVYVVLKVFFRIQFCAQPANAAEVEAGALPQFGTNVCTWDSPPRYQTPPGAKSEYQLAVQAEADGKAAEAIAHYRKALELDPNNPVFLNCLARILTTANPAALRNGAEAVELATRAVRLTDNREAIALGTLAAAYAETGDFPKAAEYAQGAQNLAALTGQWEVAAKNAELMDRYASGQKAVGP